MQLNHIIIVLCHFIDRLVVDKYGKLTADAILTCCPWLNRKVRNRASTWWVQIFDQNQKLFYDHKDYIRNSKAQDYHDTMTFIFKGMKDILNSGVMRLTLDFVSNQKLEAITIPIIICIIGDCKYNYFVCGRNGGHSLSMNGLCHNYGIILEVILRVMEVYGSISTNDESLPRPYM